MSQRKNTSEVHIIVANPRPKCVSVASNTNLFLETCFSQKNTLSPRKHLSRTWAQVRAIILHLTWHSQEMPFQMTLLLWHTGEANARSCDLNRPTICESGLKLVAILESSFSMVIISSSERVHPSYTLTWRSVEVGLTRRISEISFSRSRGRLSRHQSSMILDTFQRLTRRRRRRSCGLSGTGKIISNSVSKFTSSGISSLGRMQSSRSLAAELLKIWYVGV